MPRRWFPTRKCFGLLRIAQRHPVMFAALVAAAAAKAAALRLAAA